MKKVITSVEELFALAKAGEVIMDTDVDVTDQVLNVLKGIADQRYTVAEKPKVIDMTPFIKNGFDCEFAHSWVNNDRGYISHLKSVNRGVFYTGAGGSYTACKPRLNHPFLWSGDINLPEGLVVEYAYSRWLAVSSIFWTNTFNKSEDLPLLVRITGVKDGYVFPGGDS